jgi:TonB family protein
MLQPDPSDSRHTTDESPRLAATHAGPRDLSLSLTELAHTLSDHTGGLASAELALDLVLHEIVEQARLVTNASGAAIALVRGEEMVCRATSGGNAPGLGVRLDTRRGLSGLCVLSRQAQICADTEHDPRVDVEACRQLGVRSILVVPILEGSDLLGVFEIFSPQRRTFGDRDVQTVHALSRRIIDGIRQVEEAGAPPPLLPVEVVPPAAPSAEEIPVPTFGFEAEPTAAPKQRKDNATSILTGVVIALALVLGWMVGRAGWERAAPPKASPPRSAVTKPAATPAPTEVPENVAPPAPPPDVRESVSPPVQETRRRPAKTQVEPGNGNTSPGGLVVYEEGREVFRLAPPTKATTPSGKTNVATAAQRARVSPEFASSHLLSRVEPVYPEQARQQHVQGPVVLNAIVGKSGTVQELKVVSGDPLLVDAAADAVRQWRFRPYRSRGVPAEFETRITVNFTLPQ